MTEQSTPALPTIVVGVVPGQPDDVILEAIRIAEKFSAQIVCATVDVGRHTARTLPDGSVTSLDFNPDVTDLVHEEFDPDLADRLIHLLSRTELPRLFRALAGDPARELARLAAELNASCIVVGTRDPGLRGVTHEFFTGSVAVNLAHHQNRPIVVVPLTPVAEGAKLPWEEH